MTAPVSHTRGLVQRLREPFSHKTSFGFNIESMESHEATCLEAADTIEGLLAALRRIESQAICVGIRHDKDEADDWLYDIATQAAAAIASATGIPS